MGRRSVAFAAGLLVAIVGILALLNWNYNRTHEAKEADDVGAYFDQLGSPETDAPDTEPLPQDFVVETSDVSMRILTVETWDPATVNLGSLKPTHGRWITIEMEIEARASAFQASRTDFTIDDSRGASWDGSGLRDPEISVRDLKPGERVRGWITYDIPGPDAGPFTLAFRPETETLFRWQLDL